MYWLIWNNFSAWLLAAEAGLTTRKSTTDKLTHSVPDFWASLPSPDTLYRLTATSHVTCQRPPSLPPSTLHLVSGNFGREFSENFLERYDEVSGKILTLDSWARSSHARGWTSSRQRRRSACSRSRDRPWEELPTSPLCSTSSGPGPARTGEFSQKIRGKLMLDRPLPHPLPPPTSPPPSLLPPPTSTTPPPWSLPDPPPSAKSSPLCHPCLQGHTTPLPPFCPAPWADPLLVQPRPSWRSPLFHPPLPPFWHPPPPPQPPLSVRNSKFHWNFLTCTAAPVATTTAVAPKRAGEALVKGILRWKKRYIALDNNWLHIYKNSGVSTSGKHSINLVGATVSPHSVILTLLTRDRWHATPKPARTTPSLWTTRLRVKKLTSASTTLLICKIGWRICLKLKLTLPLTLLPYKTLFQEQNLSARTPYPPKPPKIALACTTPPLPARVLTPLQRARDLTPPLTNPTWPLTPYKHSLSDSLEISLKFPLRL